MNSQAAERLNSILAKIDRANYHIRDLDTQITAFETTRPHIVVKQKDPGTGNEDWIVKILRPIPSEISAIAGDAIHNPRAALDYLVCRLVETNGATVSKNNGFPICKSACAYHDPKTRRKIQGVSAAAKALIDGLKPYDGGNDKLWALHRLDISDKHTAFVVCAVGRVATHLTPGAFKVYTRQLQMMGIHVPKIDPTTAFPLVSGVGLSILEDGTKLGYSPPQFGPPTEKSDLDLFTTIAFNDPKIVRGKPIHPFLVELSDYIKDAVVGFANLL